jgi:hypothetical protein
MKANFNLLIPTAFLLLALAGCKSNVKTADEVVTSEYNPTDARAFGMLGDVKEVHVTIIKDNADPGEEPVVERDMLVMSFDQKGRITRDPYGNKYVYDADGNFIEGVSDKSTMERDSLGRIIAYANKLNDNDREQYGMSFFYDEQGRIATMTRSYWEVGYDDTLVYKSDKVYPDRFISDGAVESMVERVYIDYDYKEFDEKGNWTERTCKTLYKCWNTGEQESDAEVERWTTTEQRTIRYYSDEPEKTANEVAEDVDDRFFVDIFGFGLLGHVKEVVTTSFTAYEDGKGALVKQAEIEGSRATISFDAEGRVTEDPYGGIYVYDAEGNFVKGASAMSIMKRDDQQRVVNYQTKQDDEDDAMFRNDYTYDPQGRLVKVNQVFWESTETSTFVYDGDEIYPKKRLFDNYDEGLHVTSETTYRYTQFDDHGNWTQRELRYKGTEAEEDGFNNNDVTHWDGAMIEERSISYY